MDGSAADAADVRSDDGALRAVFIEHIELACAELGLDVRWSCDYWVANIRSGDRTTRIVGYTFALNDAASAELALDKVCAYQTLKEAGVVAVPHHLLHFPVLPVRWPGAASRQIRPPVVTKPHRGSSGVDVLLARNPEELRSNLRILASRYRTIAYSPYLDAAGEYRAVVLDNRVLLVYLKRRRAAVDTHGRPEWRFNLNLGARPALIDEREPVHEQVSDVASRATRALGIRFGAVDILLTAPTLTVMEVNDAFSMIYFSRFTAEYAAAAAKMYVAVLRAVFGEPGAI